MWRSISAKGAAREECMCDYVLRGESMTEQDASEGDKTEGAGEAYGEGACEYMRLRAMGIVYFIAPVATCTSG
jgi:hypothetical protein